MGVSNLRRELDASAIVTVARGFVYWDCYRWKPPEVLWFEFNDAEGECQNDQG